MLHEWFIDTSALKTAIDIVLIDFAKAYDHLHHNIIVKKLIEYGCTTYPHPMGISFLTQ